MTNLAVMASDRTSVVPSRIAQSVISARSYGEWSSIHDDFAWLRANMPLAQAQPTGYDPFWIVAKHADIQEVGRQPAIFANKEYRVALLSQHAEAAMLAAAQATGAPQAVRSVVGMDAPEHGPLRRLTFAELLPKGIRGLEDDIRALARRSIDDMAKTGARCEFVNDVALRYPMRVILKLIGLPESDEDSMLRLTQEFFNPGDTDLNASGVETPDELAAPAGFDTLAQYYNYFNALTAQRRLEPAADLASIIANGRYNGELLSDWDVMSYYITIMTAGHDTTSSSVAGGIWALAERPDQFARVKADRSLIPSLVDESIRWTTPINHFMRTATEDYMLRGQQIRAGDWLMLAYTSGNRDEEVFDAPDTFQVDRSPNPQIAFGYGAHVCLGQHLAKMEMRILFEELFDRVASIELDGPGRRNASVFVGGVKSVPIRFTMA